jgi:putative endonuclease
MAYVYFMTNAWNTVIYTGSCSELVSRTLGHKTGTFKDAFTWKYKCFKLAWYEEHTSLEEARRKEHQVKRWKREWKERLINEINPQWKDLSEGWYSEDELKRT